MPSVAALIVDDLGELPIDRVLPGARRVLQLLHGLRIEEVQLAVAPPAVSPPDSQVRRGREPRRERTRVPLLDLARDDVHADAADTRRGPREVAIDERLFEADGFEDLRAAVALQRRDAHLGHHLEDALVERLDVVERGLFARHAFDDPLGDHVVERLEGEVRVDGASAVADEERHVVHFAGVARFEEERATRTRAFAHQVVVHAGGREEARDGRALLGHATVREDQDGVARAHGRARLGLQPLHGALERGTALARIVDHRKRDRSEPVELPMVLNVPELGELVVVDDRIPDVDLPARFGLWEKQVALRSDRRFHRRHQLFTDGVERRVGHLREQLLEVVVEQARPLRQRRERRVGAHRPERLFARPRHVREEQRHVFLRVAERLLPAQDGLMIGRRQERRIRHVFDRDEVLLEPLGVGELRGELLFDLFVGDDAPLGRIDEEDPARMQPFLDQDVFGWDVQHADFRRHDDQVVLGHVVARRPQPVAVEDGADDRAVGEGDRRRTVPGLHER